MVFEGVDMNYFSENQIRDLSRPGGCVYKQGELFIFCSRFFNGVFLWDCKKRSCFEIIVSDEENNSWLYINFLKVGKILYFIPYKAKYMIGYHLETQKVEKMSVRIGHFEALYHKAAYYGENLYLFPELGKEILIYNLKKRTTVYYKLKVEEKKENARFFGNVYHCDDKVWFVTGRTRKLYCYNLELNSCTEFIASGNYGNMVDITGDDDVLFILMENGAVVAWNINGEEKKLILKGNAHNKIPYFRIHYSEDRIWLIPQDDGCVRAIDLQGNELYKWDFSDLRHLNGRLFEDSVLEGDQLIISSYYGGEIVIVDTKECSLEKLHIELRIGEIFNALVNSKMCMYSNKTQNYGTYIWKELKKW